MTTKTTATPKRVANKNAIPGPKPEFALIGDLLHYNAPKKGIEIVIDVDPPFSAITKVLTDDSIANDERAQFMTVMEMLGNQETIDEVNKLRTSEAFTLFNRWIEEVQKFMDVSLGESSGSSESSEESTETP